MFLYRVRRTLKLGIKSLWLHRLRSTLTALGIIFGVASVIAMLAIGEGASRDAQEQIARLGSLNIIVKTVQPPEDQHATGQQQGLQEYGLTYARRRTISQQHPQRPGHSAGPAHLSSGLVSKPQNTHRGNRHRPLASRNLADPPDHGPVPRLLRYGLQTGHLRHRRKGCRTNCSPSTTRMGQDIKIARDYYTVVGIVTAQPTASQQRKTTRRERPREKTSRRHNAGNVYIPLTTVKNRFGEMSIQISGKAAPKNRKSGTTGNHRKSRKSAMVQPTRDILNTLLERSTRKTIISSSSPSNCCGRPNAQNVSSASSSAQSPQSRCWSAASAL